MRREESTSRRHWALAGALVVIGVAVMSLAVAWERPAARSRLRTRVQLDSPTETVAEHSTSANAAGFRMPTLEMHSRAATAIANERPMPTRRAIAYDRRSFDQMGEAWLKEADDPEWSLNAKTFVNALIETLDDKADAHGLDELSVRCRQTVCRLDGESSELMTLTKLFGESRQEQYHVTYNLSTGDAGQQIEAYLGKEREAPTDVQ